MPWRNHKRLMRLIRNASSWTVTRSRSGRTGNPEKVNHAYENTSHYRDTFDEADIDPTDIKTRDDYQRLVPTMPKEDVRENWSVDDPFGGFLAVDRDEIDYHHTLDRTTGTPTFMPVQEEEVSAASELIARTLYPFGLEEGDVAPNAGLFPSPLQSNDRERVPRAP